MTSFIQRTIGLVVAAEAAAEEYCEGLRQAAVMPYEDVSQANKVFLWLTNEDSRAPSL